MDDYPEMISPAKLRALADGLENQNAAAEYTAGILFRALEAAEKPHYHVAGHLAGYHIDKCASCGRDLRDPIHTA